MDEVKHDSENYYAKIDFNNSIITCKARLQLQFLSRQRSIKF